MEIQLKSKTKEIELSLDDNKETDKGFDQLYESSLGNIRAQFKFVKEQIEAKQI